MEPLSRGINYPYEVENSPASTWLTILRLIIFESERNSLQSALEIYASSSMFPFPITLLQLKLEPGFVCVPYLG